MCFWHSGVAYLSTRLPLLNKKRAIIRYPVCYLWPCGSQELEGINLPFRTSSHSWNFHGLTHETHWPRCSYSGITFFAKNSLFKIIIQEEPARCSTAKINRWKKEEVFHVSRSANRVSRDAEIRRGRRVLASGTVHCVTPFHTSIFTVYHEIRIAWDFDVIANRNAAAAGPLQLSPAQFFINATLSPWVFVLSDRASHICMELRLAAFLYIHTCILVHVQVVVVYAGDTYKNGWILCVRVASLPIAPSLKVA